MLYALSPLLFCDLTPETQFYNPEPLNPEPRTPNLVCGAHAQVYL